MVADACFIACDMMYENNEWRSTGAPQPVLYISTELDLQEVQTMALAFLSGVNEEHILKNYYRMNERERVQEAARILERSSLVVEIIPDFNLRDIENIIKRSIRVNHVSYVFYDYLHTSMKILSEITQKSGIKLREDNILFLISVKLKEICTKYNIFILTSTQLNGDWKKEPVPDQNMLRGAKSIADKSDWASILLDATPEDEESLAPLVGKLGCSMPNIKMSVYKNRRGSFNKFFLWMIADKGTCRFKPIFATDYSYNHIPMEDTIIDVPGGEEE